MRNTRLDLLTDYPFQRLASLLHGIEPGAAPTALSIGEPQHNPPGFVAEILARESAGWGKYPPVNGTPDLRAAIGGWIERRYGLKSGVIEPERHVVALSGSREGLFQIAALVLDGAHGGKNVILLPNPFYQVYVGAAILAGAEPVFVPATAETGFLPDYDSLPADLLDRVALAYFCSPANPQGAVAGAQRLKKLLALARKHHFHIAADECYSEIYSGAQAPAGMLAVCAQEGGDFSHVVVFNSLSKRSSAPGLRSAFAAGDPALIADFAKMRSYGGGAMPLPIQAASAALWRDETHVVENRRRYAEKFDLADRILGHFPFYHRPAGGFFLWLDVGNGETATRVLWRDAGIKVLPGAYLARADSLGVNPGERYIRIALVQDRAVTERALSAMAGLLAPSLETAER